MEYHFAFRTPSTRALMLSIVLAAVAYPRNCLASDNGPATSAVVKAGEACLEKEDVAGALAVFTKAVELDRQNAQAFISRACAYKRSGNEEKAGADITEAIRLDPKTARVYFLRNWAYGRDHEFDRVLNYSLRSPPDDSLVWIELPGVAGMRGGCHSYLGEWKLALADFNDTVRLKPGEAAGYTCRGEVYMELGQIDKAIADLSEAIRIDPNSAESYAARAYAYAEKGELAKAEADAAKAVALTPNYSFGVFCRGYVLWKKGDRAAADKAFAEAVRAEASQRHEIELKGIHRRLDEVDTLALAYLGFTELADAESCKRFEIAASQKKQLQAILADFEYQNILAIRTEHKSPKPKKNETELRPVVGIDYSPQLAKQARVRIKECLTAKQWATYTRWKFTPNADRVIWHPEQFANLKLTDQQRDKIARLRKDCRQPDLPYPNELFFVDPDGVGIVPEHVADAAAREGAKKTAAMKGSGHAAEKYDLSREERTARENGEKLLAVLTPEQQVKLIEQMTWGIRHPRHGLNCLNCNGGQRLPFSVALSAVISARQASVQSYGV